MLARVKAEKLKEEEETLKEELRLLKIDLHEAYRRGDKIGVAEIQERIAGLSKLNNKGEVNLLAMATIIAFALMAIVLFIMF